MGVLDDIILVSAVGTAGEQEDVRLHGRNFFCIVFRQFVGIGLHHLGSGTQGCLAGRFCGQFRNQAAGNHLQTAGCAGAGIFCRVVRRKAKLFVKLRQGVYQAVVDVSLDGGVAGCSAQKLTGFQVHGCDLGVGAAKVNHQNGFHLIHQSYSMLKSSFRHLMVSSGAVPGPKTLSKPIFLNLTSTSLNGCLPTTMFPPT